MRRRSALASVAALACFSAAGPAVAKEEGKDRYDKLQPYGAVFELRPVANTGSRAAPGLKGMRMTSEWRMSCKESEYIVTTTMSVAGRGGHTVAITSETKATESHDGRSFRLISRMIDDGRDIRRHESRATLDTPDGPGEGLVTRGAPERTKLPRGTVLPGTHFMRALAAAAAGKIETRHRVYAGEDDIRLAEYTSTVLGAGTSASDPALGEFADKPGWIVRDVVQGVGVRGPARTMEYFVTRDGVMTSMKMTLQGIDLVGKAVKIEKLPKPSCP